MSLAPGTISVNGLTINVEQFRDFVIRKAKASNVRFEQPKDFELFAFNLEPELDDLKEFVTEGDVQKVDVRALARNITGPITRADEATRNMFSARDLLTEAGLLKEPQEDSAPLDDFGGDSDAEAKDKLIDGLLNRLFNHFPVLNEKCSHFSEDNFRPMAQALSYIAINNLGGLNELVSSLDLLEGEDNYQEKVKQVLEFFNQENDKPRKLPKETLSGIRKLVKFLNDALDPKPITQDKNFWLKIGGAVVGGVVALLGLFNFGKLWGKVVTAIGVIGAGVSLVWAGALQWLGINTEEVMDDLKQRARETIQETVQRGVNQVQERVRRGVDGFTRSDS